MNIFSRRKRLLTRTSARASSGLAASGRAQLRKLFRIRTAAPAMPKMSSRRQFHRALRRHPAWPMVMERAAARAKAHKEQEEAARAKLAREAAQRDRAVVEMGTITGRKRMRRILSRNRTNFMGMGKPSGRAGLGCLAIPVIPSVKGLRPDTAVAAWRRSKLRKRVRRNRVLLVTLLVVGGVFAVLTGISLAQGVWKPAVGFNEDRNRPKGRFGAATAYDESMQSTVVFGGFVGSTSASTGGVNAGAVTGPPILNDDQTYLFRGTDWGRRDPVQRPSARGFASMAYDRARRNVVLFGGAPYNTNNVSGETWIWSSHGEGWTLQNPPEPVPDPRQNAVMFYDALRREVVMFGGRGADGKPMNDTWTWNGTAWKIVPRTPGDPSPRHSAAVAYDECRAQAVMFGGTANAAGSDRAPFETWIWDGAKWISQSPKLSPTSRIGASMAYSPRTGNVLLYGGLYTNEAGVATAAVDHDVWRWVPKIPAPADQANPTWNDRTSPTWERMNSDATTAAENVLGPVTNDIFLPDAPPHPRAYATFSYLREDFWGSMFQLYGGTPSAAAGSAQVAYGDQFYFGDSGQLTGIPDNISTGNGIIPLLPENPLYRRCTNPVPLPEDPPGSEAPKLDAREGMREIGQFPLLTGTDWPDANRHTHVGPSNNLTPNPNYKPAPDCPKRAGGGSSFEESQEKDGVYNHLVTNPKRNRVFQFFFCDPKRGRGYQAPGQTQTFYGTLPDIGRLLIEAYDGATLMPLGRVVIGIGPNQGVDLAQDIERGRFYQRNSYWNGSATINELLVLQQDRIEKGADPIVKRINLAGTPFSSFSTPLDLKNFFNHPKTGRAKVFFWVAPGGATAGPPPASSTPPKIGQWDIEGEREDWRVEIPGCTTGTLTLRAMRSANHVHVVCPSSTRAAYYAAGKVPITENADGTETPGTPGAFSNGPTFAGSVWGDPQTERMLILSSKNGYTVWVFDGKVSRWVGRVGLGTPNRTSFGFDDQAGRLYVHMQDNIIGADAKTKTQGGVKVIDTRLTPVPQALNLPQFAFPPGTSFSGLASLPSAPGVPRRVFIRQAGGTMKKYPNWETVKFDNEMFYTVLADEIPVPELDNLTELDALTIPVAEKSGKTEISFDAEGSGYGIRLRSVGGIWSAVRPFQQIHDPSSFSDTLIRDLGGGHLVPACVYPDRELMAGWVPQARLSDLDALARSSGLEVDSNSKIDLTGPFSRCNPTAEASNFPASIKPVFDLLWPLYQMVQFEGNQAASQGTTVEAGKDADTKCGELKQPTPAGEVVLSDCTETSAGTISRGKDSAGNPTVRFDSTSSSWDSHFKEVECVGDALKTYQADVGNIYGSAKCVQTKGKVEATAKGSATGAGPTSEITSSAGFSIAEGYSTVSVTREPNGRGVVVTSTAIAKGIQIPGLSIGYVTTTAVAWSNGRPGVNRASFTREICNVKPPLPVNPASFNDSAPSTGCLTENQQKALVKNWNDRWGINSKMYLPTPDPEIYQGSPGGYIAGVIKPVASETEDQLFAKDSLKDVPGLEIHFYKDSEAMGNARQTLQLAAVRAVAGFGVQCNPDYIYSPQSKDCVALAFEDDLLVEEFFEEEESEDGAFNSYDEDSEGGWTEIEAIAPALSLGKRIGNFLQNLPVFRRLPIRQMGEALLAGSVWMLLGMPLFLASRRFALNLARKN